MSEQTAGNGNDDSDSDGDSAAPPLAEGTDVTADDLDVEADVTKPATSDPEQFTEDSDLGGTHGGGAGGAG